MTRYIILLLAIPLTGCPTSGYDGCVQREVVEALRSAIYATATDANDGAKAALGWLDSIGGG